MNTPHEAPATRIESPVETAAPQQPTAQSGIDAVNEIGSPLESAMRHLLKFYDGPEKHRSEQKFLELAASLKGQVEPQVVDRVRTQLLRYGRAELIVHFSVALALPDIESYFIDNLRDALDRGGRDADRALKLLDDSEVLESIPSDDPRRASIRELVLRVEPDISSDEYPCLINVLEDLGYAEEAQQFQDRLDDYEEEEDWQRGNSRGR